MAKKKWKAPISLMVEDPAQDLPEQRDPNTGTILRPFTKGVRLVAPGEEVIMDEDEIARIETRWGTWAEVEAKEKSLAELRRQAKQGGRAQMFV